MVAAVHLFISPLVLFVFVLLFVLFSFFSCKSWSKKETEKLKTHFKAPSKSPPMPTWSTPATSLMWLMWAVEISEIYLLINLLILLILLSSVMPNFVCFINEYLIYAQMYKDEVIFHLPTTSCKVADSLQVVNPGRKFTMTTPPFFRWNQWVNCIIQ